jgi:hypothetical protein
MIRNSLYIALPGRTGAIPVHVLWKAAGYSFPAIDFKHVPAGRLTILGKRRFPEPTRYNLQTPELAIKPSRRFGKLVFSHVTQRVQR